MSCISWIIQLEKKRHHTNNVAATEGVAICFLCVMLFLFPRLIAGPTPREEGTTVNSLSLMERLAWSTRIWRRLRSWCA